MLGSVITAMVTPFRADGAVDFERFRELATFLVENGSDGLVVCGTTGESPTLSDAEKLDLFRVAVDEVGHRATVIAGAGTYDTTHSIHLTRAATELGVDAILVVTPYYSKPPQRAIVRHFEEIADATDLPVVAYNIPGRVAVNIEPATMARLAEIENVVAVKIAPFNRYQTLEVVRAISEAGRDDIALYTGNDDNIVLDLLTPFRFHVDGKRVERRIVGGLLGHWAVWTKRAVELHAECRRLAQSGAAIPAELLGRGNEITDANAAFFDAANGYAGCIPGLHEVLRRQGLLEGLWCLDPKETLGPGQREEIDRVCRAYPHLNDDEFIIQHRDEWLRI